MAKTTRDINETIHILSKWKLFVAHLSARCPVAFAMKSNRHHWSPFKIFSHVLRQLDGAGSWLGPAPKVRCSDVSNGVETREFTRDVVALSK